MANNRPTPDRKKVTDIPVVSLGNYRYIRLSNVLIPFGEVELSVGQNRKY